MIDDRQIWSEDSDFKMDFTSSIYDSEPQNDTIQIKREKKKA